MGRPRSRRARQRIALALCVTWIVGFELLPWLHVALHDHLAPHHHDATGAVVLGEEPHHHHDDDRDADVDEHSHHDEAALDDEVDEHGAPVAHHRDEIDDHGRDDVVTDGRAHLARALSHGAHSLAHHGIAVPVPAPAITEPLPVDRRPFALAAIVACTPIGRAAATPSARGPPVELI